MAEEESYSKKNEFNQDSITPDHNNSFDSLKQLSMIEWSVECYYGDALEEIREGKSLNKFNCFYDALCVYYDRLRPYMFSSYLEEFDKVEQEIKMLYEQWVDGNPSSVPASLMDKLRNFKRKLFVIKQQKLKLGIPVRRELSTKDKMKRATQ